MLLRPPKFPKRVANATLPSDPCIVPDATLPSDPRAGLLRAANSLGDPASEIVFRPVPTIFESREQYFEVLEHNLTQQYLAACCTTQPSYEDFLVKIRVVQVVEIHGDEFLEVELARAFSVAPKKGRAGDGAASPRGNEREELLSKRPTTAAETGANQTGTGGDKKDEETPLDTLKGLRDWVCFSRSEEGKNGAKRYHHIRKVVLHPQDPRWEEYRHTHKLRDDTVIVEGLEGRRGDEFWVVAFVGTLLSQYAAVQRRKKVETPTQLEKAILNPGNKLENKSVPPPQGAAPSVQKQDEEGDNAVPINTTQRIAVNSLGEGCLNLIQGPPGTGKSTTIFHVAKWYLQRFSKHLQASGSTLTPTTGAQRSAAVVITAVTNVAIESVSEKMTSLEGVHGVHSLVLGNPKKLGAMAARFTLQEKALRDPFVLLLARVRLSLEAWLRTLQELQKHRIRKLVGGGKRTYTRLNANQFPKAVVRLAKVNNCRSVIDYHNGRVTSLRLKIADALVRRRLHAKTEKTIGYLESILESTLKQLEARALEAAKRATVKQTTVFLTTVASGYQLDWLRGEYEEEFPSDFAAAILDEAGATGEENIPLIVDLNAKNLVLLGDHKQLGPLVLAVEPPQELAKKMVTRSFMQRAVDASCRFSMLDTQYRMPEKLANLVSRLRYDGKLKTCEAKKQKPPRQQGATTTETANGVEPIITWHRCEMLERPLKNSYVSFEQAAIVMNLLLDSARGAALAQPKAEISVICMYKPQTALLKACVARNESLHGRPIRVITVDAAQGSESDHVILVTTRCNAEKRIGFTADLSRVNVALSRAKKSLHIVGSVATMTAWERSECAAWRTVSSECCRTVDETVDEQSRRDVVRIAEDVLPRAATMAPVESRAAGVFPAAQDFPTCVPTALPDNSDVFLQAPQQTATTSGEVCTFFLRGACSRGDACPFLHDKALAPVCAFYVRGQCNRGDACPYRHDGVKQEAPTEICSFFRKGTCTRGTACPFRHDAGPASGKGAGKRFGGKGGKGGKR